MGNSIQRTCESLEIATNDTVMSPPRCWSSELELVLGFIALGNLKNSSSSSTVELT